MNSNPIYVFRKEVPDVVAAFNRLIPSREASIGLNPKTILKKFIPFLVAGAFPARIHEKVVVRHNF